jgi:hypothetical protein
VVESLAYSSVVDVLGYDCVILPISEANSGMSSRMAASSAASMSREGSDTSSKSLRPSAAVRGGDVTLVGRSSSTSWTSCRALTSLCVRGK